MAQWLVLALAICFISPALADISRNERLELREEAREMFYHAYSNYMEHAYPEDELKPLSCSPRSRRPAGDPANRGTLDDVLGNYALTLIDTLDTLVVIGDLDEFARAISLVTSTVTFDSDVTVSVFEVTIRVLGGLLSAHFLAEKYLNETHGYPPPFELQERSLLDLAIDLGDRLMPAFHTPSKIPFSRVNLRYGVPPGESTLTCLAGAGTLVMEFGALSRASGNPKYEHAVSETMKALWDLRSRSTNLVGGLVDIYANRCVGDLSSGIGSGSDSYYEYLLKAYILFGEPEYLYMFNKSYDAIHKYMKHGTWYLDVNMHSGAIVDYKITSLQAFWPGLFVLSGDIPSAIEMHSTFYGLWRRYGFLPENFNVRKKSVAHGHSTGYPLRPEFMESTFLLYRATHDPHYLEVGKHVLHNLQNTRVPCGYAAVADVETARLEDRMDSFFLSETVKYLYLLFDEENELANSLDFLFTTEGHILPIYPPASLTTSNAFQSDSTDDTVLEKKEKETTSNSRTKPLREERTHRQRKKKLLINGMEAQTTEKSVQKTPLSPSPTTRTPTTNHPSPNPTSESQTHERKPQLTSAQIFELERRHRQEQELSSIICQIMPPIDEAGVFTRVCGRDAREKIWQDVLNEVSDATLNAMYQQEQHQQQVFNLLPLVGQGNLMTVDAWGTSITVITTAAEPEQLLYIDVLISNSEQAGKAQEKEDKDDDDQDTGDDDTTYTRGELDLMRKWKLRHLARKALAYEGKNRAGVDSMPDKEQLITYILQVQKLKQKRDEEWQCKDGECRSVDSTTADEVTAAPQPTRIQIAPALFGSSFKSLPQTTYTFVYITSMMCTDEDISALQSDAADTILGKIVMIDRGNCMFIQKVAALGRLGAAAVIIANNRQEAQPLFGMTGEIEHVLPSLRSPTGEVSLPPAALMAKETADTLKARLGEFGEHTLVQVTFELREEQEVHGAPVQLDINSIVKHFFMQQYGCKDGDCAKHLQGGTVLTINNVPRSHTTIPLADVGEEGSIEEPSQEPASADEDNTEEDHNTKVHEHDTTSSTSATDAVREDEQNTNASRVQEERQDEEEEEHQP